MTRRVRHGYLSASGLTWLLYDLTNAAFNLISFLGLDWMPAQRRIWQLDDLLVARKAWRVHPWRWRRP